MTPETAHYQAIGYVRGIYSDKLLHIRQGSYPAVGIRKAKWHLESTQNKPFRFLVYPRFDLKTEALKFQILAWDEFQEEEDIWKLAGLWQFIPQLRRPVLAVHRNEKHWEGDRLKSCYLPFVWKGDDSPRPWRFNPKAGKEDQGSPMFVSCTATLDRRFPRFFMKDLVLTLDSAPKRVRAPKAAQPPTKKKGKVREDGKFVESEGGEGLSPETPREGMEPGILELGMGAVTLGAPLAGSEAPSTEKPKPTKPTRRKPPAPRSGDEAPGDGALGDSALGDSPAGDSPAGDSPADGSREEVLAAPSAEGMTPEASTPGELVTGEMAGAIESGDTGTIEATPNPTPGEA